MAGLERSDRREAEDASSGVGQQLGGAGSGRDRCHRRLDELQTAVQLGGGLARGEARVAGGGPLGVGCGLLVHVGARHGGHDHNQGGEGRAVEK